MPWSYRLFCLRKQFKKWNSVCNDPPWSIMVFSQRCLAAYSELLVNCISLTIAQLPIVFLSLQPSLMLSILSPLLMLNDLSIPLPLGIQNNGGFSFFTLVSWNFQDCIEHLCVWLSRDLTLLPRNLLAFNHLGLHVTQNDPGWKSWGSHILFPTTISYPSNNSTHSCYLTLSSSIGFLWLPFIFSFFSFYLSQ